MVTNHVRMAKATATFAFLINSQFTKANGSSVAAKRLSIVLNRSTFLLKVAQICWR